MCCAMERTGERKCYYFREKLIYEKFHVFVSYYSKMKNSNPGTPPDFLTRF